MNVTTTCFGSCTLFQLWLRDVLTTQVIQLTSHADVMLGQVALKNIKHRDRALMFRLERHFALNTLHTNVLPQPVGLQSVWQTAITFCVIPGHWTNQSVDREKTQPARQFAKNVINDENVISSHKDQNIHEVKMLELLVHCDNGTCLLSETNQQETWSVWFHQISSACEALHPKQFEFLLSVF